MIRDLGPAAVLLGALVSLGALTVAEVARTALSDGAVRPQLVSAYRVDDAHAATFPLPGGDRQLRLVLNALGAPDALGEVVFALDLELRDPDGAVQLTRRVSVRSRRSLADPADPQSAPASDAVGTWIADPRRFDLPLPAEAAPGATLTVRSAGVPVLVRAWTARALTDTERVIRELAHEEPDDVALPDPERLLPEERSALVSWRYVRLAAAGRPGVDHALQAFAVRPVPERVDGAQRPDLDAASGAAVLIDGPADLRVVASGVGVPVSLDVRRRAGDVTPLAHAALSAPGEVVVWEGRAPAGLSTLELFADGPVQARVEGPSRASVPPGPDDRVVHLAPSAQWLEVDAAGDAPAVLETAGARRVDLEVWTAAPGASTLHISSSGHSLVVPVQTARDELAALIEGALPAQPAATAERVRLTVPPGATRLEVRATPAVWVRFHVPLDDGASAPKPPPPPIRVRGVPVVDPRWTTVRAMATPATAQIRRHARIELADPPPPPTVGVPCGLRPDGAPERLTVLEPVDADSTAPRRTEIPADRPLRLRLDHARSRARVRYEIEDLDRLGAVVPVLLDGAEVGVITAALSRGTLPLPPLAAGAHTLAAAPPPGMRLLTDLPAAPDETATSWSARTVYRLDGALRVSVRVDGDRPRGLNVVVYHPSLGARPTEVRASLDGGSPRLGPLEAYTVRSPSTVVRTLPAATGAGLATRVDGVRTPIGAARTVVIPFGDDLAPGVHTVDLRSAEPLWVRFFVIETEGACPAAPGEEE